MKHCYWTEVGIYPAIADLSVVDDETWELNRINVPRQSRGLGHGSRLLREVTRDADREGVVLVLNINPYGPLDYEALAAWYKRNGFEPTDEPYEMKRQPR